MFKDDFIPTNENSTFRNSNIAYNYKFFKGNPLNNTVKISCKKPVDCKKPHGVLCYIRTGSLTSKIRSI